MVCHLRSLWLLMQAGAITGFKLCYQTTQPVLWYCNIARRADIYPDCNWIISQLSHQHVQGRTSIVKNVKVWEDQHMHNTTHTHTHSQITYKCRHMFTSVSSEPQWETTGRILCLGVVEGHHSFIQIPHSLLNNSHKREWIICHNKRLKAQGRNK